MHIVTLQVERRQPFMSISPAHLVLPILQIFKNLWSESLDYVIGKAGVCSCLPLIGTLCEPQITGFQPSVYTKKQKE